MDHDAQAFTVPLNGYAMHLRPSELDAVAAGLGEFDASAEGNEVTLARALDGLPTNDRAPTWELAIRRYARRKPLGQAAGEIGMDLLHAQELLERYSHQLAAVPAPER
jgi:hypothetical protein